MCGEKMGNSMSIQTQKKMMTSLGLCPKSPGVTVVCETVNPENNSKVWKFRNAEFEWISGAHKIWVAKSIHIWIPSPYKEPTLIGPPIHSPQADRHYRDVKIMCDPVDIVQQNPHGFGFEILFIPAANLWTPPNMRLCLYPLSPWKWIVKHIGHCLRVLTHYPRHH